MNSLKLCFFIFLSLFLPKSNGQVSTDQVYVDENGVMRWTANQAELHGFGVNYTLPFAHEYRMAKRAGISPEDAIRQDVYHMARLDLDLYRVHVWDTEISDTLGNLLGNDHLRLFDFAVSEMKKRGIRFIITPIAYWGNGWPERDELTPGFSAKYGKADCLTNEDAIKAQANYLSQFLTHINSYTGTAYKDEPYVIGFEICNEPHHSGPPEKVTAFINKMVSSMRETGCTKPIFYNMSHSIQLADAYLNANIQGGTFQWYPTNLVANHQINGNFLPQVASYTIPFADHPKFKKMAKIIYEFDAADAGGNIMYPAMALTFREAGMQLAAQFAYDAMCWAPYNTNYGTHFMNLAYAPHKAISLKIASAIFHEINMQEHTDILKSGKIRISYPDDLAEWITNEKFFYSNNTASQPANLSQLKEIAGCGSSPVVKYDGKGAYFLDKLSKGVWRLEVMPDAYWIKDPYSPVSPTDQKAAVVHTLREMTISLPDLGENFTAYPLDQGNLFKPRVSGSQLDLMPGVYLLKQNQETSETPSNLIYKNIRIDEYVAPATNLKKTVLWNHTPEVAESGKPLHLDFEAVSANPVKKIEIILSMDDLVKTIITEPLGSGVYKVDVPSDMTATGLLNYRIVIMDDADTTVFPFERKENPQSGDNIDYSSFAITLLPENSPLLVWDAGTDWESTFKIYYRSIVLKPTPDGETALAVTFPELPAPDPTDSSDHNYAFKFYFADKIKGRSDELPHKKYLAIKAFNHLAFPQPVQVAIDRQKRVRQGRRDGDKARRNGNPDTPGQFCQRQLSCHTPTIP